MSETLRKEQQIQIQIDEPIGQGVYSNFCAVTHKQGEFIVDFIFIQPLEPKGKVRSRVVLTPVAAKQIFQTLMENMRIYEERFGRIEILAGEPKPTMMQ
ncbi:MAG: DUF3467 domain-containing protein [Nitrospirae bacterium]|nr:DUF3467 domain-containing protein [Nitrospirota bacterium]